MLPRFIDWLVNVSLKEELIDAIYGDLVEYYHNQLEKHSSATARIKLLLETLGYLRFPSLMRNSKKGHNIKAMNHLKFSIRNVLRHKSNSIISMAGLIISFTVTLSIIQYVFHEFTYDDFHEKPIYRVLHTMTSTAGIQDFAQTFYGVKDELIDQLPELEEGVQLSNTGTITFHNGDSIFRQPDVVFSTGEFFEIFDFKLLNGTFENNPSSIVVSENVAKRLFPFEESVGKVVELEGVLGQDVSVTISGVFEELPANTHLRASVIIPQALMISIADEAQLFGPNLRVANLRWLWLAFDTYYTIDPESDFESIEARANQILEEHRSERNAQVNQSHEIHFQHIAAIHNTPNVQNEFTAANDRDVLRLFGIVGILTLIIGWINYVNLNTARSINRNKEVGVRKVLGSNKRELTVQFLFESLIINLISFIVACILVLIFAPYIEDVVGVQFFDSFLSNHTIWIGAIFVLLFGSLISGYYPAKVLAGFRIIEALKGRNSNSKQGILLRRILVGVQFVFTLFLSSGLMIIYNQMQFMLNYDLGMNINSTITINRPNEPISPELTSNLETLKSRLNDINGVSKVSITSLSPGFPINARVSTEDPNPDRSGIFMQRSNVDHDFFDLYQIELLAGRLFEQSRGSEAQNAVINMSAASQLGFSTPEEAIGYNIKFVNGNFDVIGVVNDFHNQGLQFAIEPIMFSLDTALFGNFITIKTNTDLGKTMEESRKIFTSMFPDSPFESSVVENVFSEQYQAEERFQRLFGIFTILALSIAILGLIGLASFLLNLRLKEVCVRKVLGAKSAGLFYLLNKEFLVICLASFVLALPIVLKLMQEWLNDFEQRIELGVWHFLIPLIVVLTIMILSTLLQTLKVIFVNPSQILREE